MTLSLTLGLEQVRDELMLMAPPGCYWVTANRQEDARLLARQIISAQKELVLISSAGKPQQLLTPAPVGGPERIPMFSLPETAVALGRLSEDLSRAMSLRPRLLLFYTSVEQWEKLSSKQLSRWLKGMNEWLIAQQSSLLIITYGSGINTLRNHLLTSFRLLDGLAHLEWQQDSFNYRVSWWLSEQGMVADRAIRLEIKDERLTLLKDEEQSSPLTLNDENLYLAQKEVLEGAPPLSAQWQLFEDNDGLINRAQQASAATVIFNLSHNDQIASLAANIHSLRRTRGAGLKIVVREMQTSLRYSDERLLLACGVNTIVPYGAPMSRFLTTLEGIQGQTYNRHVPADLKMLLKAMQPLQEKGYLSMERFCESVTLLVNNTALPENGKGLLVALRPVPELRPEQAVTLCKPRRYGDLVTMMGDRLYLFLSSCRYNDLDTALKFIFRLPHDEIFANRLVWYEDLQILSEVRQMKELIPSAWQEVQSAGLAPVTAPVAAAPQVESRNPPQAFTLGNDAGNVKDLK